MAETKIQRFERLMMPHMNAVYDLSRWLVRDAEVAADAVQDTYAKALASFDTFADKNAKAWLITIARHNCYAWLKRARRHHDGTDFDENLHSPETDADRAAHGSPLGASPEAILHAGADRQRVRAALAALPVEFREVMVLREMEGLSYQEIASVSGIPIGTVMSRLSRARARLAKLLVAEET